jgi:methylenetetrahydrofolate dehydrogenase (NADP+)/methenyltetrahydrofolate cyclohydrolase
MLIKCKDIAEHELDKLTDDINLLIAKGQAPHARIIRVDGDKPSEKYVNNKVKKCAERNVESSICLLPNDVTMEKLLKTIEEANNDPNVHGIMLQLPLPAHLDADKAINAISPKKDIDCLTTYNVGRLLEGTSVIAPCTPQGIIDILKANNVDITGKDVLIINRSMLVGKPLAALILDNNGTPTIAHSKTKNIMDKMMDADIIITAVGKPNFFTEDMLNVLDSFANHNNKTKFIVDVSINFNKEGKMCGDVVRNDDFINSLNNIYVTAVPGGVGLTTVANLVKNTVTLAKEQINS